jgi:malonate-semialdehyde dehydrogenase (acetylating)/methylmalonate-semialdehyde dehydrogenase
MFAFKAKLEEHFEELARLVTTEHGKTLDESRGSVRRGIECVEVACGGPSMLMGYGLENVARGIDCTVMHQPLGVCAAIAPFNFPAMVPLWFLPFAVVCGNPFILKPSEQVRSRSSACSRSLDECGLPRRREPRARRPRSSRGDLRSSGIKAVSFVGSTPVARHVYQRATHAGKRVQALGARRELHRVTP